MQPHHDGSPLYLPEPPTELGQQFEVFLRVPATSAVRRVVARQVHDAEPVSVEAHLDRTEQDGTRWYRARLTQVNPVTRYRFLTDGGPNGYQWITAAGPRDHDVPDRGDFASSIHPGGPEWLSDTIAYQIFPDRFARSGRVDQPVPAWAEARSWDDDDVPGGRTSGRPFYGGDLYGVMEHLDHIESLGANLLYLTPVFPATSNHRYNASTFEEVDPLLGGNEAYAALIDAVHRRGMRIIGDFTTNHTGAEHEWFTSAQADPNASTAPFYYFTKHPDEYVGWLGHRSLPKLNYESRDLLARIAMNEDAPLRKYLRPPFGLDGWRIDVANMTGRFGAQDQNAEVARAIRSAVIGERPDAYLVGEHFHDYTVDLTGEGWQGVMLYAGFTKPLWTWLARPDLDLDEWMGMPWRGWPRLPGAAVVQTMREFSAVPWQHRNASLTIVSSHDSPRIRTITGSPELVGVAVGAMMTMPGVPMIWAGDEIGLTGSSGEEGRKPFPWSRPECWDRVTLSMYRELAAIRRASPALRGGSLRWLYADDDRIAFVREHPHETATVLLARAAGPPLDALIRSIGVQERPESDRLSTSDAPPGEAPGVWVWRDRA